MAADDVSLPDLEVIAQFSLAVRAATAPRAQVVAALEADLRALTGTPRPVGGDTGAEPRRRAVPRPGSISRDAAPQPTATEPEGEQPEVTQEPPAPVRRAAVTKAPAKKAPAQKAPAKKAAGTAAPRRPAPEA